MGVEQWAISYYNPYTSISEVYRIATGEPAVALICGISAQEMPLWAESIQGVDDGLLSAHGQISSAGKQAKPPHTFILRSRMGERRFRPECLG